jgi:hypothetical protein
LQSIFLEPPDGLQAHGEGEEFNGKIGENEKKRDNGDIKYILAFACMSMNFLSHPNFSKVPV